MRKDNAEQQQRKKQREQDLRLQMRTVGHAYLNPVNINNAAAVVELEQQINKYNNEHAEWEQVQSRTHQLLPTAPLPLPPANNNTINNNNINNIAADTGEHLQAALAQTVDSLHLQADKLLWTTRSHQRLVQGVNRSREQLFDVYDSLAFVGYKNVNEAAKLVRGVTQDPTTAAPHLIRSFTVAK